MRWEGRWGWLRGPSASAGDLPVRPFRGVAVAEPALASNAGKTSTRVIPIANKVDRSVWAGTGTAPRPCRSRTSLLCVMIILPTRVLESRRAAYLSERPQPFVLITSTQLAVKASEGRLIVESSTCVASVSDGVDSSVRARARSAPHADTRAHCISIHR